MDQNEFTSLFCARPKNFAWFLGAGTSRTAGLPTATDIIWELKRQYYCREENQEISRQDIQNDATRSRIQSFIESRGFPADGDSGEYAIYFEKIFKGDKERQRRYLGQVLSEERIKLSVGNRVLAALMASDAARVLFTTNFDSVVEKALAAVAQKSISAYHLEGSSSAINALNNEEYPVYCKLHGDFRYDNLKNLPSDLTAQNSDLSQCLINAANRFGFVICGYSGRDLSVMSLLRDALDTQNPFPHGLFWTGIKGLPISPHVDALLRHAVGRGIDAQYVEIETFDTLLLRLWRNWPEKREDLDHQVRRSAIASVNIPSPPVGKAKPLVRLNALPVLSLPTQCLELSFHRHMSWDDLRQAQKNHQQGGIILTKSSAIWSWGPAALAKATFGSDLAAIEPREFPSKLDGAENLHLRGFILEALSIGLARGKPLLVRQAKSASFLIADSKNTSGAHLAPLIDVVTTASGLVPNAFAPPTEDSPDPQKISWAEAAKLSLDIRDDKMWLLVEPDIWIWPKRARKLAIPFLDRRRADRYNPKHNSLLDAWLRVFFGETERNAEITVFPYNTGTNAENPVFRLGRRTAFTRRWTS